MGQEYEDCAKSTTNAVSEVGKEYNEWDKRVSHRRAKSGTKKKYPENILRDMYITGS